MECSLVIRVIILVLTISQPSFLFNAFVAPAPMSSSFAAGVGLPYDVAQRINVLDIFGISVLVEGMHGFSQKLFHISLQCLV